MRAFDRYGPAITIGSLLGTVWGGGALFALQWLDVIGERGWWIGFEALVVLVMGVWSAQGVWLMVESIRDSR